MLDRKLLKSQAREINRSAFVSAYLFSLIYLIIDVVLRVIDAYVSNAIPTYISEFYPYMAVPAFLNHAPYPRMLVTFIGLLVWFLGAVLSAGYVLYCMGVRQRRQMPYATLFDGFGFVGKLILVNLVMYIFITLWTILLIVPGIIAFYRYRLGTA